MGGCRDVSSLGIKGITPMAASISGHMPRFGGRVRKPQKHAETEVMITSLKFPSADQL
jgi:hypothetical protein